MTTIFTFFQIFQTNLPVFRVKESSVRRRYSDFEWLRNELERDSKVNTVSGSKLDFISGSKQDFISGVRQVQF